MMQKAQAMRPSTADLSRSLEMTFHTALMGWRSTERTVRLLRAIVENCEEKGTAEACQDDIVLKQPFHDAIQALGRTESVRQLEPTPTGEQRLWATSTPGFSEKMNLPSFGLLEYGSALTVWFTPWLQNNHTLALEFTSVPKAFEPMVEAVLGNAPSDASLSLLGLSRADVPTRRSISPSLRKQLLMMDLGVWLLDQQGTCRVPPAAGATKAPSNAMTTELAAAAAAAAPVADRSDGGEDVPADIKAGFDQLGKRLSDGFDGLFQKECLLSPAPSVAASKDEKCVPSAVAHMVDPSNYDACSLVARLANFSFMLDMPQQSMAETLKEKGQKAGEAFKEALGGDGHQAQETLREAWEGRDGMMAEMKMSWGGAFELPEQSISGTLLHLLVCNVDVDKISRSIDRLRIDGCADDKALLREELKHNVATTLPSGMTLAHLMPMTKLAGGQGTHLKIHRSPTSLMPPVLLNAKKVTMKLESSDSLADREASPRVDIYLTLCRDSTDQPFVVEQ